MNFVKSLLQKLRRNYFKIAVGLWFAVAAFLVMWQIPRTAKFKYEFQKAKPWQHETLYAPFDFPIYKSDEVLKAEREQILHDVIPYFSFDIKETAEGHSALLSALTKSNVADNEFDAVMHFYDSVQESGIFAHNKVLESLQPGSDIYVINNKITAIRHAGETRSVTDVTASVVAWMASHEFSNSELIEHLILNNLKVNVFFDEALTRQAETQALNSISETFGMIQANQLIISEGEIVSDAKYQILTSLQRKFGHDIGGVSGGRLIQLGNLLTILIVFFYFFLVLKNVRPNVFQRSKDVVTILILMLLSIIPSFLIIRSNPQMIYLMPIVVTSMIMITLFDTRMAILVQVFTVTIVSLAAPNPFEFFFMQLCAGFASVLCLSKRSNRSAYFLTSLTVFVTYVFVYLAFIMISDDSLKNINYTRIMMFAFNALLTLLALPLCFLFERMFGYVTDVSLLEYSNTNSPLLRKLAIEAPGTFQHSMQVANLCEEVLFAIGGNALLARSGALYHDVGKIRNPQYFIENQVGEYNPHNDLSNRESARIIINHVIDGVEMMRQARVPETIIDFARSHHGTRRTEYFYQMEVRNNPDVDVDPTDFCYHGPIPFSKETAVLMMCDSVEAASRSLKEHTEQNISSLVDGIVDGQFAAHQFDNTDLTLSQISTAKKILKKSLMNIYHVRIAYPNQKER